MFKSTFKSAVIEACVLVASHTFTAHTFEKFWGKVSPKLQEGVSYLEKHDAEKLSTDKSFLELVTFRDSKMARIINGCLQDFLSSEIVDLIDQVQKIQDQIAERKTRMNAWRLGLISAPSTSINPLRKTRAKLYTRIKKEQAGIDHDLKQIEVLKSQAQEKLHAAGIELTIDQLDGLLYTAEGAELAQVMAVAENIKKIQTQLGANLEQSDTSGEQVKTYTGFLMMSYRVYIEAIERAIRAIEKTYLVKLNDLSEQANEQILRAKELFEQSKKTSTIAQNNIELNAQTIRLINAYRAHLTGRLIDLKKLNKEMFINYEVAVNTYRTVKVGAELIDVISASEKDIQSVFNFEPPKLASFYDEGLKTEFERMTRKLKGVEA